MSERFEIHVTTFQIVGGVHYYGCVEIPQTRQTVDNLAHRFEFRKPAPMEPGSKYETIKFGTIAEIIEVAKKWFLSDPRVQPGDKLVIWKEYWKERNVRLDQ